MSRARPDVSMRAPDVPLGAALAFVGALFVTGGALAYVWATGFSCACPAHVPAGFSVRDAEAPEGMMALEVVALWRPPPAVRYGDIRVVAQDAPHAAPREVPWLASREGAPLVAEDAVMLGDALLVDLSVAPGAERVGLVDATCNCVFAWWPPA